ncbi:MAG TPA: hypothetical protein DIT07_00245 [Sphingobacteriaceae bacterium]|nr:hypothetical protein [Sphingobacteriaceae bacterium]
MKIRLTPLNVISSILLVAVAWLYIFADDTGWRRLGAIPLIVLWILSFIADIVFRRYLKDLKRIWIVELVFIIFVAILILIIQST